MPKNNITFKEARKSEQSFILYLGLWLMKNELLFRHWALVNHASFRWHLASIMLIVDGGRLTVDVLCVMC